ncbi:hypothetical protein B0H21DRAFT_726900 [Amylocystis lapponica]|nr:hypothetical protein B0H21DRAFT_726900 [Amylocystis lapponica]
MLPCNITRMIASHSCSVCARAGPPCYQHRSLRTLWQALLIPPSNLPHHAHCHDPHVQSVPAPAHADPMCCFPCLHNYSKDAERADNVSPVDNTAVALLRWILLAGFVLLPPAFVQLSLDAHETWAQNASHLARRACACVRAYVHVGCSPAGCSRTSPPLGSPATGGSTAPSGYGCWTRSSCEYARPPRPARRRVELTAADPRAAARSTSTRWPASRRCSSASSGATGH